MPILSCTLPGGGSGFKFGESGKCFSSRAKAEEQGRAIKASQHDMEIKEILKKYNLDGKGRREKVTRYDTFPILNTDKGKMKKTDTGFLIGSAPVAKVGVMPYLMEDGSILRELVPPETLFNQDSMNSLKMKPVTNDHPVEGRVNSDNASFRQIGFTGENVRKEDGFLMVNMTITDDLTLEDVADGLQELSPGYVTEIVFDKGVFNGEHFDAIQVSRDYNHLAVVDSARGGAEIRMQLDAANAVGYDSRLINKKDSKPKKEKKMPIFKIDNIDYEAAQEVINHTEKLKGRADKAESELKVKTDEFEKLKAERDTLKVDKEKFEKTDNAEEIQKAVKARIDLERVAHDALDGDEEKLKGIKDLNDRDLKIKVINDRLPELGKAIDEKTTEVYLDALMDTIKVSKADNKDSVADQRSASGSGTTQNKDGEEISSEKARERMIKNSQDAWKGNKETKV